MFLTWLLTAWVALVAVAGLLSFLGVVRSIRSVRNLADTEIVERDRWPSISIVIPACNEAATIRDALRTLLDEDYPDLELIVVNDRSSDETGRVIDEISRDDPRIRAHHITELPDGWLGKVNALHHGVQVARGDWILITDADVHYECGTLKKAIAHAEEQARDFVTMFPRLVPGGPLLNVAYQTFLTAVILTIRAWEIPDPESKAFTGIGHFMLMKRTAFDRTPGFAWLRMDVVDDGALGLMMKRSGASCEFLNGAGQISLRWYASFGEMARQLEKNMFAATAYYSYARLIVGTLITGSGLVAPLVALAVPDSILLPVLGASFFLFLLLTGVSVARWFRFPVFWGLFLWLGAWIMIAFQWRAGIRCWQQNGIVWRGTHYPLAALRAGMRVGQKD